MPLTRRLILQKARHHPTKGAMTDCKHTVSGTISLPSRGTFHPSLTVLNCTIGHAKYSGLPGGPGRFTADSTSPLLLGKNTHTPQPHVFRYRTVTVYGRRFHTTSPNTQFQGCQPVVASQTHASHNPLHATPTKYHPRIEFSHHLRLRSPLLTESHIVFFSYGY